MRTMLFVCAMALAAPSLAFAQTQALPTCDAPEYRALDFWVGEWDAFRADNNAPAGRSSIRREDSGCVITEHWISARRHYSGRSLNIYDRESQHWEQYWVDSTGTRVHFVGGPIENGLRIATTEPVSSAGPTPAYSRITLTRNADGTVLQLGETSPDGQAWTTSYAFVYRPHAE